MSVIIRLSTQQVADAAGCDRKTVARAVDRGDLGNLSDAEIVRESIQRNATHGHQLTRADKKKLAGQLWVTFADMNGNRVTEIAQLLAVSERTVQDWTKDARKAEKEEQQARAWDLWLDCLSYRAIADAIGVDDKTVAAWCAESAQNCGDSAPDSRQHVAGLTSRRILRKVAEVRPGPLPLPRLRLDTPRRGCMVGASCGAPRGDAQGTVTGLCLGLPARGAARWSGRRRRRGRTRMRRVEASLRRLGGSGL